MSNVKLIEDHFWPKILTTTNAGKHMIHTVTRMIRKTTETELVEIVRFHHIAEQYLQLK